MPDPATEGSSAPEPARAAHDEGDEREVPCLLCGGRDVETVIEAPDPLEPEGKIFRLVRCRKDGLTFVEPRPGPEAIGRYYPASYAPHDNAWAAAPRPFKSCSKSQLRTLDRGLGYRPEAMSAWDRWRFRRLRRRLRMHACFLIPYRSGGRILEIGCGLGGLLGFYKDRGWTVFGVEPAEAPRAEANARGVQVAPNLAALRLPDGSLDAVVFRHSLEHLHNPLAMIRDVRPLLRPDGLLVVDVPNIESMGFHRFGRHWQPLELPRHLYHFSVHTLSELVRRARYRPVEVLHSPAPDALKRSLEQTLADESTETPGWYGAWRRSRFLLKLWSRWCALRGRSDTFVLVARPSSGS